MPMPRCPRCGCPSPEGPECPRCGVVFAKLGSRPASPRRSPAGRRRSATRPALVAALIGAGVVAVVSLLASGGRTPEDPPIPVRSAPLASEAGPSATEVPTPSTPTPTSTPSPMPTCPGSEATVWPRWAEASLYGVDEPAERAAVCGLLNRLVRHEPVAATDLELVQRLRARDLENEAWRRFLVAVTDRLVDLAQGRFDYASAERYMAIAAEASPDDAGSWGRLAQARRNLHDWPGLGRAARRWIELEPGHPLAHCALAESLFHLDRIREAEAALEMSELNAPYDDPCGSFSGLLRARSVHEAGMREQRLAGPGRAPRTARPPRRRRGSRRGSLATRTSLAIAGIGSASNNGRPNWRWTGGSRRWRPTRIRSLPAS